MSSNPQRAPSSRLSRQGFQPLNNNTGYEMQTNDIPLQTVVSHTPSHAATIRRGDSNDEKSGLFHRGRRKAARINTQTGAPYPDHDHEEEKTGMNRMGMIYMKILNFSIVTRYMIYVAPLALILAIPIILAKTVWRGNVDGHPKHTIGGADETRFWVWLEIVWLSFWACKIVAHFLPEIFQFLVGVVSPGVRKYALLLRAIEKPLSFVFWAIVNQVTFPVLVQETRGNWKNIMLSILRAILVSSCILLAERILIQLISISYHRKQFDSKIKESKRNIFLVGLLYDASRALFPQYCDEFAEEDYVIQDGLQLGLGSRKTTLGPGRPERPGHKRSGTGTPMRLLADVERFGDKVTSAFGTVAQEITGKKIMDPNAAHSIVLEALEKNRSAEALARRLWMSFVIEGKNALFREDLVEVMGPGRQDEANECFSALDKDANGDISLEEMILTVTEFGRERKSIATSMHDVDQAINALDGLLFTIVFIVCIFVFIAFLSPSFVATLTTSATALLSLSFVFAATCQEVLGSCIYLFVKHPYDIGDRVDIGTDQLTVEHISLLYTVFKRVTNGKVVQTPNIVLNNLWVENITRSKAMREQISIFVAFDTTFEDINALKQEMLNFIHDPLNNRDFHPELEIEVVSIAEMNKLELRCDIQHKSNWSNESLRAARRSKFMCALVVALRKIPISGPGGSDAALGDANKPSWSVSISPEHAQAARDKYLADKDASRLFPSKPKQPDSDDDDTIGKGQSSSTDYLSPLNTETHAINTLNTRRPGADPIRDDTWNNRDDVSTLGRPSMDVSRPDLDEVRGLLHKVSSGGKRKQAASPYETQPRPTMPPLPIPINPSPQATNFGPQASNFSNAYMQPPPQPTSPSSISTGHFEDAHYQPMINPQRSAGQAASQTTGTVPAEGNASAQAQAQQRPILPPPRTAPQSPRASNNPFRTGPQSPEEHYPYKV